MEIRVSFFIGNKIIAAGKAMQDNIKTTGIEDPMLKGWDYYDSEKDAGYIQMLMQADTVEINGGEFKILSRQIRANRPHALWITVEPTKEYREPNFKLIP